MDIKEAKSFIQAGFAFANWDDKQKQAFAVAWECMTKCQQKELKPEGLMLALRQYHQMTVYTVDEKWCIQLFDLDVAANGKASCIYEDQNRNIEKLVLDALEWVVRNKELY